MHLYDEKKIKKIMIRSLHAPTHFSANAMKAALNAPAIAEKADQDLSDA
jgi:hypothetical protein